MSAIKAVMGARAAGIQLRVEGGDLLMEAAARRHHLCWNVSPVTSRRSSPCCGQADVLTVVLAITGIGGVVFRKTAKARIG